MKVLLIDPSISGISGNMVLSALIDAGGDEKKFLKIVNIISKKFGCKISVKKKRVQKKGISALWVDVDTNGKYKDLISAIKQLPLTPKEREFALKVADTLIEAEAKVHGTQPKKVHLHELASLDTLIDIAGTATLAGSLDIFGGAAVYSSPVMAGRGKIKTAHGVLPIPAPVTAEILKKYKIPFLISEKEGELATPTGVAILANLANSYGNPPPMEIEKIGVGAGTFELDNPNILRVMIGNSKAELQKESITLLETNVDDVSGEILGYTLERLYEDGALDVQMISTITKKSRPGYIIQVICKEADEEKLARILIQETGSLGIRTSRVHKRFYLNRETKRVNINISNYRGAVRVKVAKDPEGKIVNVKPEYEDARKVAKKTGLPLRAVIKEIEKQVTF